MCHVAHCSCHEPACGWGDVIIKWMALNTTVFTWCYGLDMHPSALKWAQTQTGSGGKLLTQSKSRKCFENSFANHKKGMKKCPSRLVHHTVQKRTSTMVWGQLWHLASWVTCSCTRGQLQCHMVDILGLLGDIFFIAEHDCYSSFYQVPRGTLQG